jgi:hypothetical protein
LSVFTFADFLEWDHFPVKCWWMMASSLAWPHWGNSYAVDSLPEVHSSGTGFCTAGAGDLHVDTFPQWGRGTFMNSAPQLIGNAQKPLTKSSRAL